jgi:hypothetical protein
VRGILQDVADGHRGGGEAVDEERFILALDEVNDDQRAQEILDPGRRRKLFGGLE